MAEAGALVYATDINEETLSSLTHDNIRTFILDVRNEASVLAGVEETKPDILFNCAGFVHAGTMLQSTDEEWDFGMDLNVRSMYRMTRAALPYMIEKGTGSIINMSSVVSSVTGVPNRFIYHVTKAAVIGLTKSVATDYMTSGVRVVTLSALAQSKARHYMIASLPQVTMIKRCKILLTASLWAGLGSQMRSPP